MKQLTRSAYDKAAAYIRSQARPLEQARYACHFENGALAAVLDELAAFQNDDGGFGHGLEPDVRLADSSVIATTIAFQVFREFGVSGDHPMVFRACRYLMDTYDAPRANWPIIPANVDDAPHAPWWIPGGDLDQSLANPRAEIVGYLNDYPEHFPAAMREQLTSAVVDYLLERPDTIKMHDLLCYMRLWNTRNLAQDLRSRILEQLRPIVENSVEQNRAGWQAYGLQPLSIASTPDSPFADRFQDAIEQNLDFIIETQAEHGGWMPTWSWGENWPDAWAQAQREWSGCITLDNLRTLHAYGRIDL
jgi:hypothetical protein